MPKNKQKDYMKLKTFLEFIYRNTTYNDYITSRWLGLYFREIYERRRIPCMSTFPYIESQDGCVANQSISVVLTVSNIEKSPKGIQQTMAIYYADKLLAILEKIEIYSHNSEETSVNYPLYNLKAIPRKMS